MKIDKYIEAMQKLRNEHGPDMEVVNAEGVKKPLPRVGYMHVKRRALWVDGTDLDKDRGAKVVKA